MSAYLLQDLIRVREHREDKASKAVTAAMRAVKEANEQLEARQKELKDYHIWRLQEEERLMDSIMKKPVRLGEITDLKAEIGFLREKEMAYKDAVTQAEAELDRARKALEEAKMVHKKAQQDLEKLLEHREAWKEEQSLEEERLSDLELEDFRSKPTLDLTPDPQVYEVH